MRASLVAVVLAAVVPALAAPNPEPNPNPEPQTFDDPHKIFARYSCSVFSDYCPQDCLAGRKDRDCSASYVSPPPRGSPFLPPYVFASRAYPVPRRESVGLQAGQRG